jgi:DNA-binding beta-propeller fold protein YncE
MNTISGPPVNLAITPDQHLALVANSLDWIKDGDAWKGGPDNKIYVIDLTTSPPQQIGTVEAGKQASGMAINHAGTLALVTNRAEDSVTVPGAGEQRNARAKLATPRPTGPAALQAKSTTQSALGRNVPISASVSKPTWQLPLPQSSCRAGLASCTRRPARPDDRV